MPSTTSLRSCLIIPFVFACSTGKAHDNHGVRGSSAQAIVDGKNEPAHRETAVLIRADSSFSAIEEICSVVFVTTRLALTAAHCVGVLSDEGSSPNCDEGGTKLSKVVAAKRILVYTDEVLDDGTGIVGTESHAVSKIVVAPDAGARLCGNDVAVLELAEPLDETIVPTAVRVERAVEVDDTVSISGYGFDGEAATTIQRRSRDGAKVTSVGETKTSTGDLRSISTEWVIDRGPCKGDSGSPAFDADGALVGVMSRGLGSVCTSMIYSRVDEGGGLGTWIRETVREASQRNGDPLPTWAEAPAASDHHDSEESAESAPEERQPAAKEAGCSVVQRPSSSTSLALASSIAMLVLARRRRNAHTSLHLYLRERS